MTCKVRDFDTEAVRLYVKPPYKAGWGNEDKENTAPLKGPYYDTNTALFTSFTLSMHYMIAISHWLSHIIDVAGECKLDPWVIN